MIKKANAILVAAAISLASFSAHAAFNATMTADQIKAEIEAQPAGTSLDAIAAAAILAGVDAGTLTAVLVVMPGFDASAVITAVIKAAPDSSDGAVVAAAIQAGVPSATVNAAAQAGGMPSGAVATAIASAQSSGSQGGGQGGSQTGSPTGNQTGGSGGGGCVKGVSPC